MIQINNLRIRKHDCITWTLEKRHITLCGAITWCNIDYYSTREEATRDLFFRSIPEQDSIAGLIQVIENAKNSIEKALAS